MSPFSRPTLLSLRILNLLITITSLALFAAFFVQLAAYWEPQVLAICTFPIIGLGVTIIWNILILIFALTRTHISKWIHLSLDITFCGILIILGAYGSWHNASNYLSNGSWKLGLSWGVDRDWLSEQIAAFSLLGIAAALQILIAILSFWGRGENLRVDRGLTRADLPTYEESFERTDERNGEESIVSLESMSKEKKGKFAESYA